MNPVCSYIIPQVFVMLPLNVCKNMNTNKSGVPPCPSSIMSSSCSASVFPENPCFPVPAPAPTNGNCLLNVQYPFLEQFFYQRPCGNGCGCCTPPTPLVYYYLKLTPTLCNQYTFTIVSFTSSVVNEPVGSGTATLCYNNLDLTFDISGFLGSSGSSIGSASSSSSTALTPTTTTSNEEGHILFFKCNLERLGLAYFCGDKVSSLLPGWYKLYPSTVCNYPSRGYYF